MAAASYEFPMKNYAAPWAAMYSLIQALVNKDRDKENYKEDKEIILGKDRECELGVTSRNNYGLFPPEPEWHYWLLIKGHRR